MALTPKDIRETIVIKVGFLGMADEGIGTAEFTIPASMMTENMDGERVAQAFILPAVQYAFQQAMLQVLTPLLDHLVDQQASDD